MIVPPYGDKDSAIALVGEAPGADEEKLGRPFCGKAGKHLASLCNSAGIPFSSLYLTNVIKERPPNNDVSKFIELERDVVMTDEYRRYERELKEELSSVSANVIVACGSVSLWALCRLRGITKYRGSILESTLLPGRKVIPIIHPAAALREYLYNHHIVHDLIRVREESLSPEIVLPKYTIIKKPSADFVLSYLNNLHSDRIGFDIEVVKEQVDCLAISVSPREALCIAFQDHKRDVFSLEQEVEIWKAIGRILENPSIEKVMQNAVFDCGFLYQRYGIRTINIHDTMIAQGLLTPDFPKDLGFITSIHTRHPYYKDDGKMYKKISMPSEAWWDYNGRDAIVLLDILPHQLEDLKRSSLEDTYNSHRRLIPILLYIMKLGIKMDADGLKYAAENATIKIAQLQAELDKLTKVPINPNSPKQLQTYFYIEKKVKPFMKDGRPSCDETAMKRLAVMGHEEARIILEMRKLIKMRGTYYEAKLDPDGRIRSSYNPIGTTTGRLSSSRTIFGTGMNMQNQPSEMKKFMLVDDGYVAYTMDLSSAENRIVANMGPVPAMKEAFDKGMDVHSLTAALIFKVRYEDVSREPGSAPIGDGSKSQRDWGKMMNHSSNYGIGPLSLGLKLEISAAEAKFLLSAYHEAYPEVRFAYQAQISAMVRKDRRVWNCFGRSRRFMDRISDYTMQDAYAFPPQSTVADIINRRGLIYIWQNISLFEHLRILNQVHDSITVEIPISLGWKRHCEMLSAIKRNIELPLRWRVTEWVIPLDIKMCFPTLHDEIAIKDLSSESLEVAYKKLLEKSDEKSF